MNSGNDKKYQEEIQRSRKKTLTSLLRAVLGLTFITSSLLKLNDPLGLAFKMEEYLSPEALDMQFLAPLAENMAIALIALELILGLSLILGRFKVFTLWTLFIMNVAFMLLTLYSAVTGVVDDCGCFGDAIPMSSWSSFSKNVVICLLLGLLIVWQRFIKPIAGFRTSMSIVAGAFALAYGMSYYVIRHEPLVDFRPFAVGVNIPEAMAIPDDAELPVYENIWTYSIDGKEEKYTDADEPWNIPGAKFIDRKSVLVKEGFVPAITELYICDQLGGDITEYVMSLDSVYMILCYDFNAVDENMWEQVKEFATRHKEQVCILSNSSATRFVEKGITAPVYHLDPITIKTIMRSNPGVVHLSRGTIIAKVPMEDVDTIK